MVLKTHHVTVLKKNLRYVLFWVIMQRIMKTELYVSISALHDDTQQSLRYKQMHMCWDQAMTTDEDIQLDPPTWHYKKYIYIKIINSGVLNPSAWGHLNPSSYCDVGRLFYGVFKLWSKLQRKK